MKFGFEPRKAIESGIKEAKTPCRKCGGTLKNHGYYWQCDECGFRTGRHWRYDPHGFRV